MGGDEVPGCHLPLAVHPHQRAVGLLALERDRPQPAMAVPGQEPESDHRQNPRSMMIVGGDSEEPKKMIGELGTAGLGVQVKR